MADFASVIEVFSILSRLEIIGVDVSHDWVNIHCLLNADADQAELERMARDRAALVCFNATGGHEWRLCECVEAARLDARQLPPAQIKSFGKGRSTLAKTDRIFGEQAVARKLVVIANALCKSRRPSRRKPDDVRSAHSESVGKLFSIHARIRGPAESADGIVHKLSRHRTKPARTRILTTLRYSCSNVRQLTTKSQIQPQIAETYCICLPS